MVNKSNLSRNIAILGVFAVLTALVGAGSWVSTVPLPSKSLHAAAAPVLTGAFDVIDTPTQTVTVEFLNAKDTRAGTVEETYPRAPYALEQSARAWGEERVDGFDGEGRLEIGFEPYFAAGEYLGIGLSATITGGARNSREEQNFVAEVGTEEVWPVQDLAADRAAGDLAGYLRQAVKAGALAIAHPSPPAALALAREGLPRARFIPEGFALPVPGTRKSLVVKDPGAQLTARGARVAAAVAAQEEFVGLPAPTGGDANVGEPLKFPGEGGVDCREEKCIALTFDDGPEPGTHRLLDILAAQDVRATFFLVGNQIPGREEIVQRLVAEGHIVGNHTWSHVQLPKQSRKQVRTEIDRATEAIVGAGAPDPTLLRPPYGALSDMVRSEIAGRGYATILWDVDTLDWHTRDTKKTVKGALEAARPGGIILMHDIHAETIDAVPTIISELRERGFTLVTVPELFGGELNIGGVYRNNH